MKKIRYVLIILLFLWGGVILFLSFQNGTETAQTSARFTEWLFRLLRVDTTDGNVMMLWDHRLRVAAHVITFYIYGLIGALVFDEKFAKNRIWLLVFIASGLGLAVWAEAGKVQMGIPGRHCDPGEMMLNISGFAVGFLLTCGVICGWNLIRKKKQS